MFITYVMNLSIWATTTQLAHDGLETFLEGPQKILPSGTYREPSGNSQGTNKKNYDFNEKNYFLVAIVLRIVLHIYSCFLHEEKIFRSYKRGLPQHLRGPIAGLPGPNDGTFLKGSQDVGHTCFLNSTHKHIKFTLAGYSRLYSE